MGVQKSAQNRPPFLAKCTPFFDPLDPFYCIFMWQFFMKSQKSWNFSLKKFFVHKSRNFQNVLVKIKSDKKFSFKENYNFALQKLAKIDKIWWNWTQKWSKIGHFWIIPQNRLKLAISRPKIGSRFYPKSYRLSDLQNRQFADLSAELATLF